MKKRFHLMGLTLALVISGAAFASPVKTKKPKHSPEYYAAVKKCDADYKAAEKEARTKKGQERKDAEMSAKKTHKQCIADAPK